MTILHRRSKRQGCRWMSIQLSNNRFKFLRLDLAFVFEGAEEYFIKVIFKRIT